MGRCMEDGEALPQSKVLYPVPGFLADMRYSFPGGTYGNCEKGYTLLGNIALIAVIIPIFIAIPRMIKQDKADKQMTGGNGTL